MARYRFVEGKPWAGRLHAIRRRPIENSPRSQLSLLRLEFEIFAIFPEEQTLRSTGAVACRDLIIGPPVDASRDSTVAMYADALRLRDPSQVSAWLSPPREPVWMKIIFGQVGSADLRNAFQSIFPFPVKGWTIEEFRYDLAQEWVTVAQAARNLKTSAATVRRRVDEFEPDWGARLVMRTPGAHRRVNLPLLRNLWREAPNSARH